MSKYYTDPWEPMRNRNKRIRNKRNRETKKMFKEMSGLVGILFLPITILIKLFTPKKRGRKKKLF